MSNMLHPPGHGAVIRPIPARLAPALLAVATTLLLGAVGTPHPGAWQLLESLGRESLTGLFFAAGAGLLACHLAQTSVTPSPTSAAAFPAALIAASLPGPGSLALLIPLALAAHQIHQTRRLQLLAALGLAGVVAGIVAAALHSPAIGTVGALAMLAAATLMIRHATRPAANDNLRDEPFVAFWGLPDAPTHATHPERTSSPVLGE
ncbi:hypothetical protein [Sphingomonas sp. LM7]|uniref:hypothetical protein n=1 Tax=Sphingomonas sp. LM7 TaxID=1938607 RepID=UPI000983D850|nr:hypothetical protein [Sphingomonas sp. LM7]AQR75386.1 hypothetical protein BXU08_18565 [Sphingomonas sp. LM7]